MLPITCEERWISLNRLMRVWVKDGTRQADLLTDVCLAFKDGRVDDRGLLLIDKIGDRVLSPNVRQLYPYVFTLRDHIFVSKEVADNLRVQCNRSPPSGSADGIKGASQPSRPPEHLPPAPEAMIKEEIKFEYQRAATAGEKSLSTAYLTTEGLLGEQTADPKARGGPRVQMSPLAAREAMEQAGQEIASNAQLASFLT
jgi:hypothetical protein